MPQPQCPYCGRPTQLASFQEVYPELQAPEPRLYYRCAPCDAHIQCDLQTLRPQGRLANPQLRQLKRQLHARFDALWKGPHSTLSRSAAHRFLAKLMEMPDAACQLAWFDLAQCQRALRLLGDQQAMQAAGQRQARPVRSRLGNTIVTVRRSRSIVIDRPA
ncbi:zinc-finger-containing protein [Chitinimonas sp.]|uniref:zinc-finger-containing protein n=1 Tax=Chitinimonas sp. TaxID=1934313 RepID=UPI0035B172E2